MSIRKKKGSHYYECRFTIKGKRYSESTKCTTRLGAERYEAKRKQELMDELIYGVKPQRTWKQAKERWLIEMQDKRSINEDQSKFKWLDDHLNHLNLSEITNDVIESIAFKKASEETVHSNATINRVLALIKSVLNRAQKQWQWIDRVPYIRMREEPKGVIRWLTKDEADRLLKALPRHLKVMAAFTLATGLRSKNVSLLRWKNVDLENRILIIDSSEFKSKKTFSLPLNASAVAILKEQYGKHPEYVFTYNNKKVVDCNTRAFRSALKRVGIENFRWHDLRHTWASWHVQNGTSLQELQQLGGWSSFDMVLRYAHLSKENLQTAANRVDDIFDVLNSSVSKGCLSRQINLGNKNKLGQNLGRGLSLKRRKSVQVLDSTGADARNRTAGLLITNPTTPKKPDKK